MTTLDALKANLSQVHGLVVSDNAFLKALLDEDLSGSETYSNSGYEESVDKATIRVYRQVIAAAGFEEGDVSYSPAQIEGAKKAIDGLLIKNGMPPEYGSRPTVRGVSAW